MDRRGTGTTRRRLLSGSVIVATGVTAGYLRRTPPEGAGASSTRGEERTDAAGGETAPERTDASDPPDIVGVTVTDLLRHPLSRTHPSVHNRADTQYVVVRVAGGGREPREIREALRLTFGGPTAPLAVRQLVPWRRDTVDVAFAVSKGRRFDEGVVRYRETAVHTLGSAALDRLNEPPRFVVSDVDVSPGELDAGREATATVRLTVTNEGAGAGTFGASLTGNSVPGAETVTARLDAGTRRDVVGGVGVVGRGETVAVGVDWGFGRRQVTIPVVGTATVTATGATPAVAGTTTDERGGKKS